jgi:hypothetical protein
MSANPWHTRVNASALSDEARRLILERVKEKLGFERTLRVLGIARGSLATTYTRLGLYQTTWFTRPSNTSIHTKHLDDTYLLIPLVKSSLKEKIIVFVLPPNIIFSSVLVAELPLE